MQRPDTVPADATWEADDNEWMLAPRDDDGEYHGLVTWWRPDGTRVCATPFAHGAADGDFQRFHENGEVSRSGAFDGGTLVGTHTFWRSTATTTENFPAGLADAVWRCEMDYRAGQIVEARAYDHEGKRVLEDGSPFPDTRPEGVPETAHFRKREADSTWRWVDGAVHDNDDGTIARLGTWRFWTPEGVLVSEETWADGAQHGPSRTFDPETGALVGESSWEEGDETGPFLRIVEDDHFADDRVAFERGTLDDGDRVGRLELLDAEREVLHVVDLGADLDANAIAFALNAEEPARVIEELEGHGQQVVAWLATAIDDASRDAMVARLTTLQPPLSEDAAQHETHRAKMIAHNIVRFGGGPVQVLSGLLGGVRAGGDAGELLRQAAAMIDDLGDEALATQLIDAACRLQPDEKGHEYTRALIRMSQGDPEGADTAIRELATASPGAAQMLGSYRQALFADLRAPIEADPRMELVEELGAMLPTPHREKAPPAAMVRRAMQQTATRIHHVRQVLTERFGTVWWLPPALDHLLPDGPVEVDLPQGSGVGLLHAARRDLLRLGWMCWSLGLDGRFLPDTAAIDTDRPSRALALVVLARALQLEDSEPDVTRWVDDLEPEVQAKVVALLRDRAADQRWFGMALPDCDHAAKQFAFDDELALFKMLLQWWNDSDEGTWFDLEASEE